MDKSRRVQWLKHSSRRDHHKRMRDELDHVAQDIVAKIRRELSGRLKDDADRLRRERNKVDDDNEQIRANNDRLCSLSDRLRAECERNRQPPPSGAAIVSVCQTNQCRFHIDQHLQNIPYQPMCRLKL